MFQVGARADVHVQAGDRDPGLVGATQAIVDLGVPNSVLALLAAGIGLLAVTVTEAGIDPQRDVATRGAVRPTG